MSKLEGYSKVAVIYAGGRPYHYALYDESIKSGDNVIVTGAATEYFHTVTEVISVEESNEALKGKTISAEVICKVDVEAYVDRLEARKKKEELKKKMDKRKKEIQQQIDMRFYAEKDEEFAKMYDEFLNL